MFRFSEWQKRSEKKTEKENNTHKQKKHDIFGCFHHSIIYISAKETFYVITRLFEAGGWVV